MMKKLMCLLLTACMLLTGLGFAALADGMDSFVPVRTYDGRFADVTYSDWFYGSVAALYELGLTDGQSEHSFGAGSSVTLAETISFAARIHSAYYLGSAQLGPALYSGWGGDWYQPYLTYLQSSGVVDSRFDGEYGRAATRAQTAYILSRVLPAEELGYINAETVQLAYNSGLFITDVLETTSYAKEIISLYAAGIVTGSDGTGSFLPYTEITRAELAAMLTRVVDPQKRVTINWLPAGGAEPEPVTPVIPVNPEPAVTPEAPVKPVTPVTPPETPVQPELPVTPEPSGVSYPDLVWEQGQYIPSHAVDDTQSILSNVRWLFANGETDIDLRLDPSAAQPSMLNLLLDNYLTASQLYLEQGYTAASCRYDTRGNVTLSFYNPNGGDRDAALKKAVEIHDRLHADGTISSGMNEVEIARAYAQYLCRTCEYNYASPDVSHTAYGALINGSAVCEGYTAAYNILLKLEGINCSTEQFPNHIWTTATLDGIFYHIDVTWCDQSYGFENRYFCMTPEFSMSRDANGLF